MNLPPDDLKGAYIRAAWLMMDKEERPLRPQEIIDLAKRNDLLSDKLVGATKHFTLHAQLCMHIKCYGEDSIFVRTAPGVFYLRAKTTRSVAANPTKVIKTGEQVLTFEASLLDELERFQGISGDWRSFHNLLSSNYARLRHLPRLAAETTDGWKQVLTYIIVTRGQQVLMFHRGSYNQTEEYLRGSACIGFGGHVTEQDSNLFDPLGIVENAKRELNEELGLPDIDKERLASGKHLEPIGVLNDDSSTVGQKHFAFLFRYEVSEDSYWDAPKKGEQSINQPQWLGVSASSRVPIWNFEYWSQLCLGSYFAPLVQMLPAYKILGKKMQKSLSAPHVLCIMGAIGSGKSEATGILKRNFAYSEINTGLIVADLMGLPPVPETSREEFCRNSLAFISQADGPERLAAAIAERVESTSSERILVDGIRHRRTLHALRERLAPRRLVVVHVDTLPHIAYRFYRDREADGSTVFDFLRVRQLDVESEVQELLQESDVVLYNSSGIEHYVNLISELVHALGGALGE